VIAGTAGTTCGFNLATCGTTACRSSGGETLWIRRRSFISGARACRRRIEANGQTISITEPVRHLLRVGLADRCPCYAWSKPTAWILRVLGEGFHIARHGRFPTGIGKNGL
jgi:hypothetical protein